MRVGLSSGWMLRLVRKVPEGRRTMSSTVDQRETDVVSKLRELFLFRGWAGDDLASLARIARVRTVQGGVVLFQQGETCEWMHVLARGKVRLLRVQPDGREALLHVLAAPALVACAALFVGGYYPAEARVESGTAELVELRGEPLLDLLARRPDLARRLLAALAGRITDLADRLESQNSDNAVTRVAKWMVDLPRISGHGSSIMIPGTKKAAAAALMMTPETFSRSLRALQDAGIVRVDGRRVYILEVARLLGAAGA